MEANDAIMGVIVWVVSLVGFCGVFVGFLRGFCGVLWGFCGVFVGVFESF